MASIITATTTSGLTQSADNSGVLQLSSGTGNLVTVPSVTGTAMVSGNMPAFSAYQASSQTISSGTWTKVTFGTEEFDTNSNFASSRLTPTVAGYYQLNASIAVGTSFTAIIPAIYKNGSQYKVGNRGNAATQLNSNVSSLVFLNGSTDYVEIYVNIGIGQNTNSDSDQTYFNGSMVRGS
jgi:hypothetical protein